MTRFAALLGASLAFAIPAEAKITKTAWGESPGHQKVDLYTLTNAHGMSVNISTYGAVMQSLKVPDRDGKLGDVVRGFDSLDGYLTGGNSHIGAVIGRYANRIKGAKFTLEGTAYRLNVNSQGNNIHGGPIGFDKRVWTAETHEGPSPSVTLSRVSYDGEMNFPGTLKVSVTYTLEADNALRLDYRATTDKPTVLNLTNHAYFNLNGAGSGEVLNQKLQINADNITLSDPDSTPNGRTRPVAGTAFDFREAKPIGAGINDSDPQIAGQHGYDQNFIINGKPGTLRLAARAEDPASGRVMEVLTTQPGVQLYTANNGKPFTGKNGETYVPHGAFCLETNHYANSPNIPSFPTTELKPGETFHETTVFRFPKPQ